MKKNQFYQYLFYDYHLVFILATVGDTSTSISNSLVSLHTIYDPFKHSRLDFSNPKQTFVHIQLLATDYGKSLFSGLFVPKASKTFGTLLYYP